MEMKSLLKEWRVWVLVFALFTSLLLLAPHYETRDGKVVLDTSLNKGLELSGGTRILLDVQGNNTTKAQVDSIKNILETRVSAFGLTQTDIRTVRLGDTYKIQVEVASTNQTRLKELIAQEGSFEARMPVRVYDTKKFTIDNTYTFTNTEAGVSVGNKSYNKEGATFELDGQRFYYVNETGQYARLEVVAYSGEDVEDVITSQAMVRQQGSSFSFSFPVVISKEAAQDVKQISSNYDTVMLGGQPYLGFQNGDPAKLKLYVDNNMQSALNVAATFKNSVITQPSITGSEDTGAAARKEMKRLQAILQSGKLPAPVKIESISTITSSLGAEFLSAAFISIILSLIAVGGLVFLRYGDPRVAIPIVITGSSEVFILIGAWFSTVATLDLASIAGIIAAVGTGVDDQIIITDESGREKVRSWKERMKKAFFVIFTSAASTIGAMVPLVSLSLANLAVGAAGAGLIGYTLYSRGTNPHYVVIGALAGAVSFAGMAMNPSSFALQSVRGFAITTILGVLVGITITRPAYAKFIEKLDR